MGEHGRRPRRRPRGMLRRRWRPPSSLSSATSSSLSSTSSSLAAATTRPGGGGGGASDEAGYGAPARVEPSGPFLSLLDTASSVPLQMGRVCSPLGFETLGFGRTGPWRLGTTLWWRPVLRRALHQRRVPRWFGSLELFLMISWRWR